MNDHIILIFLIFILISFLFGKVNGIQKEKNNQIKNNNKLKKKYEKINNNDIGTIIDRLRKHKY